LRWHWKMCHERTWSVGTPCQDARKSAAFHTCVPLACWHAYEGKKRRGGVTAQRHTAIYSPGGHSSCSQATGPRSGDSAGTAMTEPRDRRDLTTGAGDYETRAPSPAVPHPPPCPANPPPGRVRLSPATQEALDRARRGLPAPPSLSPERRAWVEEQWRQAGYPDGKRPPPRPQGMAQAEYEASRARRKREARKRWERGQDQR